jgi:hypothetical protein
VIVQVAGEPAGSLGALRDRLLVGTKVSVLVSRGGSGHELSLEVAQRPTPRCG